LSLYHDKFIKFCGQRYHKSVLIIGHGLWWCYHWNMIIFSCYHSSGFIFHVIKISFSCYHGNHIMLMYQDADAHYHYNMIMVVMITIITWGLQQYYQQVGKRVLTVRNRVKTKSWLFFFKVVRRQIGSKAITVTIIKIRIITFVTAND
jgi:hypothetical protein